MSGCRDNGWKLSTNQRKSFEGHGTLIGLSVTYVSSINFEMTRRVPVSYDQILPPVLDIRVRGENNQFHVHNMGISHSQYHADRMINFTNQSIAVPVWNRYGELMPRSWSETWFGHTGQTDGYPSFQYWSYEHGSTKYESFKSWNTWPKLWSRAVANDCRNRGRGCGYLIKRLVLALSPGCSINGIPHVHHMSISYRRYCVEMGCKALVNESIKSK